MTTTQVLTHTEQQLGFPPGCEVEVRQDGDDSWMTLSPITYHAKHETFHVPAGQRTDFASVPRYFVWLVPRYGRYTKAAILHDFLCRAAAEPGGISRVDADGIFRQAMRTLDVGFLRRWIMWAAVRAAVVTKPTGRRGWLRASWQVLLIALLMAPVLLPAMLVVVATLGVFWLIEMAFWLALLVGGQAKPGEGKRVNRPTLSLRL